MNMHDAVKVYSIGFMLEDVKVRFMHDLRLDIFDIHLDSKEDDILTLPRWLANILQESKVVEIQEQDMSIELSRALSRERIAGSEQITALRPDFYIRLRKFIDKAEWMDRERLLISMHDIMLMRLGKVINLARSSQLTPELEQKLTIEEKILFNSIYKVTTDFKDQVMGAKS